MTVSTPPRIPAALPLPHALARRVVFWVVVATAGVVLVASIFASFPADPQQGEGWIAGPIMAIFMGGPLIAVAFGLRSPRQSVARRTAIGALLLALAVGFVLVMQLLDPNETAADRLEQGFGVLLYLAAFAVELPAFTSQWPSSNAPVPK